MASRTVVTLLCDVPHPMETRATEALSFGFNGSAYDIDLCAEHSNELRAHITSLTEHARRAAAPRHAGTDMRTYKLRVNARERNALIRQWARQQGRPVSERGRLSVSLIKEYEAAAH